LKKGEREQQYGWYGVLKKLNVETTFCSTYAPNTIVGKGLIAEGLK
jgi:hypothetical protein